MVRRLAVVVLLSTACGVSTSGEKDPPMGPPVTAGAASALPPADPYLPPLSGHRLALLDDVAIVSDPEGITDDGRGPRVDLVSLTDHVLIASLSLPDGANPQAVVVSSDNNAYVVAAGLGGVYAIDVAHRALGPFTAVCPAPVDAATRGTDVLVACRSGELVTLTATGKTLRWLGAPLAAVAVDAQSNVFVALQNAQVLEMDTSFSSPPPSVMIDDSRMAQPNTPRRLVPIPGGGVTMLYQQSLTGDLTTSMLTTSAGGGAGGGPSTSGGDAAYSGGSSGSSCAVPATRSAVTQLGAQGGFLSQRWVPAALAVDAAVDDTGNVAVADPAGGQILFMSWLNFQEGDDDCFPTDASAPTLPLGFDSPMAVAWYGTTLVVLDGGDGLYLKTVKNPLQGLTERTVEAAVPLRSRAPSVGFALFHRDPLRNGSFSTPEFHNSVTCASCHPDGLSNGATVTLDGTTRRVMPVAEHTRGAPLMHWEGLSFHDAVADKTWHVNMGGESLSQGEEDSLRAYLDQLRLPARPAPDRTNDVALGELAFDKAGCSGCHLKNGRFTNDAMADVGRGLHKVPSLLGLAYTAPYMSDGCAATLEQRFTDAACGGGARHGNVAALAPLEEQALLAYLKTL